MNESNEINGARRLRRYKRADSAMQASDSKEERVLLLDSWVAMEEGMAEGGERGRGDMCGCVRVEGGRGCEVPARRRCYDTERLRGR